MDTSYTDGLFRMIGQRIKAAKGNEAEIDFHYKLAAMVMSAVTRLRMVGA